jgi:hypothetical protein
MATWKPLPAVPTQAFGGDTPITGKYGSGRGATIQQPPSHPWKPAYPIGTAIVTTGGTVGYPV